MKNDRSRKKNFGTLFYETADHPV